MTARERAISNLIMNGYFSTADAIVATIEDGGHDMVILDAAEVERLRALEAAIEPVMHIPLEAMLHTHLVQITERIRKAKGGG